MRFLIGLFSAALFIFPLTSTLRADNKTWIEVRSPHFRIITNGTETVAHRLAREFEQMRAVFANQFPGFRLESGAPLLVIAPRDLEVAKNLVPAVFNRKGTGVAGVYFHGWEKQYAIVRLDTVSADPMFTDAYSVIYHEYVHSLLHMNFHWLPTWLDEGLASFYQYTRFENARTMIGAPPRNMGWINVLDRNPPIPLETFLTINPASPYYGRDESKTYLFYAQAWAMTHFLTFGPGMGQGQKLTQFFNLLQQGMEQKKAFVETFGELKDVDKGFFLYIQKFAFTSGELPPQGKVEEKDFATRNVPIGEVDAEVAGVHILTHSWKEMREFTEAALKEDPKLGIAHEEMGYLQFNEDKNENALREFSQAFEFDGTLYRSLFAKTMISPISRSNDPADEKEFHDQLLRVLDINPKFAPAFVELAKLYVREGELNKALGLSRKAEQLEPWRAGYHLLSGQILLRLGRDTDAAANAAYVANRWASLDHDEAMELWNAIPADKRVAETLTEGKEPKPDWQTAEGTVKSVTCQEHFLTVTLTHGNEVQSFHSENLPVGFSDTLWWGRDHFTPCFHVASLRAVVHFKPATDKAYTGDLMNVGFREDLPAEVKSPSETSAAPK